MDIYVFDSTTHRTVSAFTSDCTGVNLPADYAPWHRGRSGRTLNSDALPYSVAKTVQLCGYFLLCGGSDSSGKRRPPAKSASLPRDPSPTFPTAYPRPLPASSPPPCSFPPPKPAGVMPLAETDAGPALGDGMVAIERAVRDGTASKLGVMRRPWPLSGKDRWLAGIAVRSQGREYHYRPRNEPEGASRRRVGTIASADFCSSGDSPGNWRFLR
jgi:hypothetical protein